MLKDYSVFIRIDVKAESKDDALIIAENSLETINKPDGFNHWEHYEVEEV